jgi:AcrR family transcriptional regulator
MSNMAVSRLPADRDARRAARREALLDAADRAIRRAGPGVSMDEIAAEAGVTKPILYRAFGDKRGLTAALAERYLEMLLARLHAAEREPDPRRRLAQTLDAYLALVEREPEVYRFLVQETIAELQEAFAARRGAGTATASFIRRVAAEVEAMLRAEARRLGLDESRAEAWAHAIVGMVQQASDWWLERRDVPRRRLVESLTELLWSGLSSLALRPARTSGRAAPARSAPSPRGARATGA